MRKTKKGRGGVRPGSGRPAQRFILRDGDTVTVALDVPLPEWVGNNPYKAYRGVLKVLRPGYAAVEVGPGKWVQISNE